MSDNWNNAAKKIGGVGLAAVMAVGSMGTGAVTALAVHFRRRDHHDKP